MQITQHKQDGWTVAAVDGNIDHDNSLVFSTELLALINGGETRIRLDLGACDFVCSSGLGAIAAALMVARSRGGDMEVLNAGNNVRNLFRTTRLNTILKVSRERG